MFGGWTEGDFYYCKRQWVLTPVPCVSRYWSLCVIVTLRIKGWFFTTPSKCPWKSLKTAMTVKVDMKLVWASRKGKLPSGHCRLSCSVRIPFGNCDVWVSWNLCFTDNFCFLFSAYLGTCGRMTAEVDSNGEMYLKSSFKIWNEN